MSFALLGLAVAATVVTLSTRNDWDRAAVCGSAAAASKGRCVTEQTGTMTNVGAQECSGGAGSYSCDGLPVDMRFADGSRRHFEFSSDRIFGFLDGGQRNPFVVPGARQTDGGGLDPALLDGLGGAPPPGTGARVIGRFDGRYLVGLRFPATGAVLATNDYPSYREHGVAEVLMFVFPVLALFTFFVYAYRAQKAAKKALPEAVAK